MAHRRHVVWLAAISLLLGLAGQSPHAQSQLPTLRLSTNQAIVSSGNTLAVNLGVQHTGATMLIDVLFGVILPGSDAVVFFEGPGLVPGTGRVSRPASIRPMFASLAVGAGIDVLIPDFFRYTWQGQEPLGDYQFFFAATTPGAFRDGRIDGGDLLALQMATVRHVPRATVTVDTSRAVSAVVSVAGGSVTAVGADGAQYVLAVPPGAIAQSTTITVTPVLSLTGLTSTLQLVSAVRAEPAGLVFDVPATLTITLAAGPAPAGIVGIHTTAAGAGLELLPAAATNDGSVLVSNITHFSVVGIAVPAEPGGLLSFPGSSFHDAVVAADDNPAIQRSVLERWFDQLIWSLLRTGQTDTTSLLRGMREFLDWQGQRIIYSVAQTPLTTPAIQIQAAEGRRLIADGLRAAVARHNSLCVSERSLARAEEVMRLQALAESTAAVLAGQGFVQAGFVTALQPSLDLSGLSLTSVAQNLCVDVSIISTSFPGSGSLTPGVPAPLTVRAGMTFTGGGAPLFSPPLQVVVDAVGGTPAQRVGFTDSSGNFQTTFTPQTTGMGLSVLAAFVDATHPYLSNAALNDSTIVGGAVIVTPPQTTITLGASRQFSAVVEGTSNQAVTWSVTGGGSITQTGLFTSAGVVGTFFVKATSVADPSMVGVAQVTVGVGSCLSNPVVGPTGQGVPRGGTRQFFATSSPGGPPVDVTWSIVGSGGTISADGLFTAGATATTQFEVKATCISDPSLSGTATVTVLGLRVGRYESIPNTARVFFLGDSGPCVIAADHQPGSWTLDVTSLPTGFLPYMVTVTNIDPSGTAVRYDAQGKGLDDPTHRLEMTAVMAGVSIRYFKLATDTNSAALVAIHPQGFCPADGQSYAARLWEVSFND